MVDKVISEFEVRDLASEALRQIEERMNAARRSGEALVTTEEKNDRARRAALKSFENLERAQNRLQAAEQRRDQQLTRIARAESLGVATKDRLVRAERNVQEAFEQTARALRGNTTAYEQLRNRLDPITRSQREFAIGQDVIQKALERGEVSLERNAAELERVQAALDDQARSTRFTSDAYAQLQQRLDPLIAAQREFDIAQSTVNDALARGRIDAAQAASDMARLRQEFEQASAAARNQGNALDDLEASLDPVVAATRRYNQDLAAIETAQREGTVEDERAARIKGLLADRLREVTEATSDNVTAFDRLRNEIDPLARAEAELARRIRIVEDAVKSGETTEVEAGRVKQALTARVEDLRASIERQGSAYQRIADRIDPVSAAERRLAADLRTVDQALEAGEIGLEEHGRAAVALRAELDRLKNGTDTSSNAFRELQLRIDPAARALDEFRRDSDIVTAALRRQEIGAEQAAAALRILEERYRRAGQSADRADDNFGNVGRGVGRLNVAFQVGAAAISAFAGSLVIRKLAEFNDILQQSENRLRIVTDGVGELAVTQGALFASSQRSFTAIIGGVEIYERLARSTQNLEISNQRLLTVTEAVQKSVALSGTTTLAANAALIQFGQGLAANSLRGQELNSVMEQTPRLARALAEGLGFGIGELRSLANQGELTAELVIKAIESQVDVINSEFATIEPTLEQATQAFENSATVIGDAFAKPIFDVFIEQLEQLNTFLSDPETKKNAQDLGNQLAASFEFAAERLVKFTQELGEPFAQRVAQNAFLVDSFIAASDSPDVDPRRLKELEFSAQLQIVNFEKVVELRREQLAVEKLINEEVTKFRRQESIESIGAAFGLTAAAARQAAVNAGVLDSNIDALDEAKAKEFAKTLAEIGAGKFDQPIEEIRKEWEEANRQLAIFQDLGPEAVAALNAAVTQARPQIEAFISRLETRLGDLRKEREEERIEDSPLEVFNEQFPGASDEARARVAALAAEIAALDVDTKKAAKSFAELALEARQLSDLQIEREAAQRGGREGLEGAREEIELQRELIRLEAEARENGEAFDRAAEESRLRQVATLERQIELALDAYDELERRRERIRDDIAEGVDDDIGRITERAGRDRRFASANRGQADLAFQQAIEALNRRLAEFEEVDSLAFNEQEDIDEIRDAFGDAADEIRDAMFDGAEELERSIRDSVANLTGSLIEDLLFNAGRGIGDIFQDQLRESLGDIVIGPLQDFLSGDSQDLFGDIEAGLNKTIERFQKVGNQLDKVFGTGGTFAELLGGAGAGFAGFGLGTGAADILNGSQGETGSKVGGAAGGAIGFAVGGPVGAFVGSAVGGFFGDIFGGLFGRKTATGTIDFLTGETDLTDSKKDGRNDQRNLILEQSVQAIEALAEALGANIRPGTGLEVNVGKRSTTTDIIDPATGRVIRRAGTSAPGDIDDAISDIIDAALDSVLTGGNENLRAIAEAFSAADVPAEQLLESLSSLSSIFDFIEEPASEFSQILDEVVDVFEDASAVAGRYAAAQRQIAEAQLETLQALAGRFDEDVEEATRRLTDPVLQDALDLSEEQIRRIEDATRLNQEILDAINAVNAAPAGGAGPDRPGGRFIDFLGADGRRLLEDVAAASTAPGATADTVSLTEAQAAAQERLNAVIRLNIEEFRAFIQNAGNTPEAFAAVSAAIAQLSESAEDLGLDFDVLADELEALREGIADEFDESERRRRLSVENPLALQAEELIDAQAAIIESANAIGGTQEELADRLARVFETNALEIEQFIETAASTPDAIGEIIEALERLKERADEVGLTPGQIDEAGQGAIIGAGDGFLRSLNQDFLEFTNAPLARFTQLLEQQQRLVETAARFAQFNPQRFGGLPTIVQNRNALEREQFLDDLSDEDRLELGNFLGLIEDYGGRIAVVTTQLRDTLDTTVTEIEDELERLSGVAEGAFENANSLADARQSILDRFFPGSPLEQLDDISARLEAAFTQALTGDEQALADVESLAGRLVDQGADVFGANDQFVAVRDRALEILRLTEEAERARGEEAERQIDILEADLEVSRNILASLESAQDNTLFLQSIVENGVLQNQLLEETIAELIRLRALQSGVDLGRVDAVAGITDPNQILGALRTTSSIPNPTTDQINAILRSISTNSATDFTFAQSSLDFASQIADIVALARQSAPEITGASSEPVTATPTQPPSIRSSATAPSANQNTDVVLAIGGLETTLVSALTTLAAAIDSLKEEVRILRQDNQRLNNELKAAYRLAVTQSG